jgi:hypothetical protein
MEDEPVIQPGPDLVILGEDDRVGVIIDDEGLKGAIRLGGDGMKGLG